jgi:hypothetical protein
MFTKTATEKKQLQTYNLNFSPQHQNPSADGFLTVLQPINKLKLLWDANKTLILFAIVSLFLVIFYNPENSIVFNLDSGFVNEICSSWNITPSKKQEIGVLYGKEISIIFILLRLVFISLITALIYYIKNFCNWSYWKKIGYVSILISMNVIITILFRLPLIWVTFFPKTTSDVLVDNFLMGKVRKLWNDEQRHNHLNRLFQEYVEPLKDKDLILWFQKIQEQFLPGYTKGPESVLKEFLHKLDLEIAKNRAQVVNEHLLKNLSEKVVSPKPKVGFWENAVDSGWKFLNLYNPMVTEPLTCAAMWVGTIFIFGSIYFYCQNSNSVKELDAKVNVVSTKTEFLDSKVNAVSTKTESIDTKVNAVSIKTKFLDTKVNAVSTKTKSLDTKINTVSTKTEFLDTKVNAVSTKTQFLDTKVNAVSTKTEFLDKNLVLLNKKFYEILESMSKEIDAQLNLGIEDTAAHYSWIKMLKTGMEAGWIEIVEQKNAMASGLIELKFVKLQGNSQRLELESLQELVSNLSSKITVLENSGLRLRSLTSEQVLVAIQQNSGQARSTERLTEEDWVEITQMISVGIAAGLAT